MSKDNTSALAKKKKVGEKLEEVQGVKEGDTNSKQF
jgi:hypothetical protein